MSYQPLANGSVILNGSSILNGSDTFIINGSASLFFNGSATLFLNGSATSSCNDLHACRTIWNIIWSNLVTLFACIWLSIHPNIPAPEDSWGTRVARRAWMMVLALLAPELIVGWATRQLIVASRIAGENKSGACQLRSTGLANHLLFF